MFGAFGERFVRANIAKHHEKHTTAVSTRHLRDAPSGPMRQDVGVFKGDA